MQLQLVILILIVTHLHLSLAGCRPSNDYKSYICLGMRFKVSNRTRLVRQNATEVRISDCKETHLAQNASPLTFLIVENLTISCDINEIDKDAFRNLNRLQELDLGNNTLSALPEHLFETLGNLRTLNLSNNNFEHLTTNMFDGLSNLRQLIFSHNMISDLDMKVLDKTDQLEEIYLNHNEISFIPIKLFSKTRKLSRIDLSYNAIENLGETFISTYNLVYLNLSHNVIQELPIRVFKTTRLEILDLSNNKLTIVYEDSFPLESLQELHLQNNQISLVDINGHSASRILLNFLDVRNNRLVFLEDDLIKKATSLITLKVEGNPWDCKCFEKMEILRGNLSVEVSVGYHNGEEPLCVVGNSNDCNLDKNNLVYYYNILKEQMELR